MRGKRGLARLRVHMAGFLPLAFGLAVVHGPAGAQTTDCPDCPPGMALIPAGSFEMGDILIDGQPGERPMRTVFVSAVYMAKHEVTKALWDEVAAWAEKKGYDIRPADDDGKAADHPVYDVLWFEAVKWCNARSEKEGLTPCYTVGGNVYRTGQSTPDCNWSPSGYRLPTEAEWEKAARGGVEGSRFPWGDADTIQHSRANYRSVLGCHYDTSPTRDYHPTYAVGGRPYTSPVGSFAPNGYGLYDMAGNVWEWCWDFPGSYGRSHGPDPRGSREGSLRVLRGGSWRYDARFCRVAARYAFGPNLRCLDVGFRLVRTAP